MPSFSAIFLAASAALTGMAMPVDSMIDASEVVNATEADVPLLFKRQGIPSGTGTNNGWYYSWWSDGSGNHVYNNGAGGAYSVEWSGNGNFVGGKGYQTGSARTISFDATFNPQNNGNAYLTVYGWTRSPLVEYYILENIGEYNPCASSSQPKGTVTVDGSSYEICQNTRTNAPSIDGTQTFQQYISVRQSKRSSGSVDVGAHFEAWQAAGMQLGTQDYQIFATEGYNSAGNAQVTVS
ncbi:Endo-1,4-beta-xylanase [Cercospora zeina]